ncbi:MAG: hypothetical protein RIF41_11500 [Polyangiaceae bacterium]
MLQAKNDEWHLWFNMMPPGPPFLHVTAQLVAPDNATGADLSRHSIEKSNPPNLILELTEKTIFASSDGGGGERVVRVHYSEQALPGSYGAIKILAGGKIVKEFPASEIDLVY